MTDLTDDAFLGGQLQILQPRSSYRAGLDAVLLAAAVPVVEGGAERVLDAGAGVGVVGLAIARRVSDARVSLVEIEPDLIELARQNIARNGLAGRVEVIVADVMAGGAGFTQVTRAQNQEWPRPNPGAYAHVAANPPYLLDGHRSPSPDPLKTRAHGMGAGGLDAWARFLATAAKHGGTATVIHRADALAALLAALDGRFGALKILPIHPRAGLPASRVILQGSKGSRAPLELRPALVLHGEGAGFLPPVDAILRGGHKLVV